jgi:hypothetical protein
LLPEQKDRVDKSLFLLDPEKRLGALSQAAGVLKMYKEALGMQ